MNTLTLRNIVLGEGTPKIIVPIVDKIRAQITDKAATLSSMEIDIVEWRADHFEQVDDLAAVSSVLRELRGILKDKILLFTFRTKREGGERDISPENYLELNSCAAKSGCADLVDVEIFSGDEAVLANISAIHDAGAKVVGSNHDFFKTPSKETLVARLRKMQDMGADIPKIAVMANSPQDTLTLLDATYEMYSQYADRPILTMSMKGIGSISRMSGELYGSCATFGSVGQGSAPGQVSADALSQVLKVMHQAII